MVMRSDTAATAPLQGARAGWSDRARYMATIARGHTWHGAVPEGAKPVVRVADASGGIPAEIVSMWANAAKAPVPQPVAPAERSRGGYLDKLTASGAIDPDAPVNVAPDWQGLTRDVNGVVASMLPVAQAARFFGADEYAGYLDESRAGLNPLVARAVEYAGHLGGSGASHMPQVPAVARTVPKLPERAATAAIDAWMPQNAVGIFGGRLAKTADLTKLAKAEEMASKGIPRLPSFKEWTARLAFERYRAVPEKIGGRTIAVSNPLLSKVLVDRKGNRYVRDGGAVRPASASDLKAHWRREVSEMRILRAQATAKKSGHEAQIRDVISHARSLGATARIVKPDDSASRYAYIRKGGVLIKVRVADHGQPMEGGRYVGGFSRELGRRHAAADVSLDPDTKIDVERAKAILSNRLGGIMAAKASAGAGGDFGK